MNSNGKQTAGRLAIRTVVCFLLLLADSAGAQITGDRFVGAGAPESTGGQMQGTGGMPDVSGIQQQMQAQMMQQMAQQMQAASPAAQMARQPSLPSSAGQQMQGTGGMPDVSGIQQQMQAQMMQQMAQQMQAASPAAQMMQQTPSQQVSPSSAGIAPGIGGIPDAGGIQQQMRGQVAPQVMQQTARQMQAASPAVQMMQQTPSQQVSPSSAGIAPGIGVIPDAGGIQQQMRGQVVPQVMQQTARQMQAASPAQGGAQR